MKVKRVFYIFFIVANLTLTINFFGQDFYGMVKTDSNLWVDATEITNNEYRQFVLYVKDSLARELLFKNRQSEYGVFLYPNDSADEKHLLNWKVPIDWTDSIQSIILEELYYPKDEYFYMQKLINPKNLIYRCSSSDSGITEELNIYPDTLCWVNSDSTIYLSSLRGMYFWHPAFDDYPVVGINYAQAIAFCHWRSNIYNNYHNKKASKLKVKYSLPSLRQWNYIAKLGNLGGEYGGTITNPISPRTKEELKYLKKHDFLVNARETHLFLTDDSFQIMATISALDTFGTKINDDKRNKIYGLSGNVAEMTLDEFITGGSWFHSIDKCIIGETINHDSDVSAPWLGFRCIVSIIK